MRVTIKGQVTIPKDVRKKTGIHPGMEVDIKEKNGEVVIHKASSKNSVDQVYGILKGKSLWKNTDQFIELVRGRL